MQDLSPIGWALRPLKNYAKFSGRASRAEFWWFFLFVMLTYAVAMFIVMRSVAAMTPTQAADPAATIGFMNSGSGIVLTIFGAFWLALLIPTIAVQVRRLHDTNRSGWWLGAFWLMYLLYMMFAFGLMATSLGSPGAAPNLGGAAAFGIFAIVFFIYTIVLFVFFCLRGTQGANRFGEDPYGPDVEQVFA